jgi:hypothetical protein
VLIETKKAGGGVNSISFDFIVVVRVGKWRTINPIIRVVRYNNIAYHDYGILM